VTVPADGTALYRVRGENGLLLYIGISDGFGRRWKDHSRKQPWWDEMRSLSVDCWYESRADAEEAEKAAIRDEKPKYNKKHAVPAQPRRRTVKARRPAPAHPYPTPARTADPDTPGWYFSVDSLKGWQRAGNHGTEYPRRLIGAGGSC
jgi:predicted GIY-YIG superfamily endonuclease